MRKLLFALCVFWSLGAQQPVKKIGLLMMATGKYIRFIEPLVRSADKFFCNNHDVTYFVFTDGEVPIHPKIVKVFQKRLGWPLDTLMRFPVYYESREKLASMDYLFAIDADMLFVGQMGDEILSDLVGTLSPGYIGTRGTPETNPISTACIKQNENDYYFAGGIVGGSGVEFLKMAGIITKNISIDSEKNYIAIWHDESHLNRYFVDHKPTKILGALYCYPECWRERHPNYWARDYAQVKLLNINKDLKWMRS